MALLSTALGGCHVAILKHVLRLRKIEWDEIQLEVEAEETEEDPKVYTDTHLAYEVTGADLDERKLRPAGPWPRRPAPSVSCCTTRGST